MDKIKRTDLEDGKYFIIRANVAGIFTEYFDKDDKRHREDGPAMTSNFEKDDDRYLEWWENGNLVGTYSKKSGILKKSNNGTFTGLYEVEYPSKWKGYEQSLSLHDLGHCNAKNITDKNESTSSSRYRSYMPKSDKVVEINKDLTDGQKPSVISHNELPPITPKVEAPTPTKETKEVIIDTRSLNFKQRLQAIKKQRVASEELLLNSHIENLANFNIEKRLTENAEFAKKDLFKKKIFGSINASVIVGAVGGAALMVPATFMLPAAGLAFTGLIVFNSAISDGLPMFESAFNLFKSAKGHNLDLVENELAYLRSNVKNATVNDKTTVTDYFNASKQSIVNAYSAVAEQTKKLFRPLSVEDVSERINKMKQVQEDLLKNKIRSPKIN